MATGERFAILERRTAEGRPVIATVNVALKRVDHLLLDHHVTVTVPLREPTPLGLTTSAEAEVLNAVEDELLEKQGRDAVYIGRETGEGRRVLHFHASGSGSFAQRAQEWAKRHAPRKLEIVVSPDPRWEVLDRW